MNIRSFYWNILFYICICVSFVNIIEYTGRIEIDLGVIVNIWYILFCSGYGRVYFLCILVYICIGDGIVMVVRVGFFNEDMEFV